MIAATMLYALAVSIPIALAVAGIAFLLRRAGKPERWVWGVGVLAALLMPPVLAYWRTLAGPGSIPGPPQGVVALPEMVVVPSEGFWWDAGTALIGLWVLVSAYVAIRTARTMWRLRTERRNWRPARVAGEDVLLTPDLGPAVYGVSDPVILLPEHMRGLPGQQLSLIVRHEREHIRAGDPWLLAGGLMLRVFFPWHIGLAFLTGGLRQALEIDCDRRVTRGHGDVGRYGETVLAVAALGLSTARPLPAFTESTRFIKRRLIAMTVPPRTLGRLGLAAVAGVAVLALAGACEVPLPMEGVEEADTQAVVTPLPDAPREIAISETTPERDGPPPPPEEVDAAVAASPTFTPYTVAPSILNREEVVQAMATEYPPLLRDAGVEGSVRVYFFIDEDGGVQGVRIDQSSGHRALDEAALAVAHKYRFSPALDRDKRVPVWVSFPITFQVR